MKKENFLLTVLWFFISNLLYGQESYLIKVTTSKDSYMFKKGNFSEHILLDKGRLFTIESFGAIRSPVNIGKRHQIPFLGTEKNELLSLQDLTPYRIKNVLPSNYISLGDDYSDYVYIPSVFLEAFVNNDKDLITSVLDMNYCEYPINYSQLAEYLSGNMDFYPIFSNVILSFFSLEYFFVKNISKLSNTEYLLQCRMGGNRSYYYDEEETIYYLFQNMTDGSLKKGDEFDIRIVLDGDYVHFYDAEKNKLLITHVLVSKKTARMCSDFLTDKEVDVSKVEWPRHRDGSSEFNV